MKWRLLSSFLISGLGLALLAVFCLDGVASLYGRRALPPAAALLQASARTLEAELSLRGRTLAELSEEVAGDPDLPAELEAVSGRANHRISQFRGVRPEVDEMTLMDARGVVVGTNAPRYRVGDSLLARDAGSTPAGAASPKVASVGTPGQLDAVLTGYPSRGVSSVNDVLYQWGAAPILVKHEVVGAVLIERRLEALPPVAGCDAFLVLGGRVVLGRWQAGWRSFLAGGSGEPFLMLPKDVAASRGERPMFVDRDRIGVWAQRFHMPGSAAAVGFVTIDLTPAYAELASFQRTLVNMAIVVWLVTIALLIATSRLATIDGRWLQWLSARFLVVRQRIGELRAGAPAPPSIESPTVTVTPAQPRGAGAAPDGEDAKVTPPLGVQLPALRGIIDELPLPGGAEPPTGAAAADEADEDATSTIAMTPELMAELGIDDLPEDPSLETRVMALTPELLAEMKAGPGPEASAAPAPPPEVAEDPVYREVYTRFIGMRKFCGQPADLAFEAFKEDLEKSQAQVIAQHGCKRVRFHVVVRSGKAILAATPLP